MEENRKTCKKAERYARKKDSMTNNEHFPLLFMYNFTNKNKKKLKRIYIRFINIQTDE